MRMLLCDICQAVMKDGDKPFAFGVGSNHPAVASPTLMGWSTGTEAEEASPFTMPRPFKFVKQWEMCPKCGLELLEVLAKAALKGAKELAEFKKLMQ